MKIYKFEENYIKINSDLFSVTEYEVEEKPKIYIGSGRRVNKSDIDTLQYCYNYYMYRLSNDPTLFIEKTIERKKEIIIRHQERFNAQKENLRQWEALKGGDNK